MKRLRLLGGIVFVVSLLWTAGIIFSAPKTEAATLNVVAGTDAIEENGQCQLSEAIQNINDQAQTNDDCLAGDGNEDTINLPSGTISLSNYIRISRAIIVQGNGANFSIIDGQGIAGGFYMPDVSDTETVVLNGFKITAWNGLAINSEKGNLVLENIEIDGSGSALNDSGGGAIIVGNQGSNAVPNTIEANNIYIHDISADTGYIHLFNVWTSYGNTLNAFAKNVSISDITNIGGGINVMAWGIGVMQFDGWGNFTGTIENTTITNVTAGRGVASFLGITNAVNNLQESGTTNISVKNSTISAIHSGVSDFGINASFGAFGTSFDENTSSIVNVDVADVILNDSTFSDVPATCGQADASSLFQATGVAEVHLTSSGGNISDDTSCSSYFTDPTDQNNVDPADLMLGTLGNYGGSIPTIPLLPGSIAIDSGTTVAGLTTDARGVSRPQCSAYDSGAYEYNGTCPVVDNNDTIALTYPDPITSSTVTLELPSDVTNGTVSAIGPTTIPKDTFFSYPLGLTSFQFDTTIGATKTITLYYDLPGDPSSYIPRKYNTNTKTFATIQGATITRVTYNNKSMIKLTYDITDGGTLDQDNIANGTIVDPVGLAAASVGVPETGIR